MIYGHGGDIYTHKPDLDFSVNVNPLGPPEGVVRAASRERSGWRPIRTAGAGCFGRSCR